MNFEWIDFYTEFATKLLEFKDNREKLIHKIYSIYDNIGISVPKLEKDNEITDIDPVSYTHLRAHETDFLMVLLQNFKYLRIYRLILMGFRY